MCLFDNVAKTLSSYIFCHGCSWLVGWWVGRWVSKLKMVHAIRWCKRSKEWSCTRVSRVFFPLLECSNPKPRGMFVMLSFVRIVYGTITHLSEFNANKTLFGPKRLIIILLSGCEPHLSLFWDHLSFAGYNLQFKQSSFFCQCLELVADFPSPCYLVPHPIPSQQSLCDLWPNLIGSAFSARIFVKRVEIWK